MHLFDPDHTKLHFPLAKENRNLVEHIQLVANRSQTSTLGSDVQGVRQVLESSSGDVFTFDSDRKNRFGTNPSTLLLFAIHLGSFLAFTSLPALPDIENGPDG